MKSNCFICSISKSVFQKHGLNFHNHISDVHNHWDYCYYLLDILHTDEDELNGIQSFVLHRYRDGDYSWIPLGITMDLEGLEDLGN